MLFVGLKFIVDGENMGNKTINQPLHPLPKLYLPGSHDGVIYDLRACRDLVPVVERLHPLMGLDGVVFPLTDDGYGFRDGTDDVWEVKIRYRLFETVTKIE